MSPIRTDPPSPGTPEFRSWAAGMSAIAIGNARSSRARGIRLLHRALDSADMQRDEHAALVWLHAATVWERLDQLSTCLRRRWESPADCERAIVAAEQRYSSALADVRVAEQILATGSDQDLAA